MRPLDVDNRMDVSARFADFADREAHGNSARYDTWCRAIAADHDLCALIASLPAHKQQPNLVLAATRYLRVPELPAEDFLQWLRDNWDDVRHEVLARATQTNEPGRTAAILPLLAQIGGPIALIEVGASAGLCLYPDRYSHVYDGGVRIDPADGPSAVETACTTMGGVPIPQVLPKIVSRSGIDLNPLDVSDPDDMRWLHALIWPGQRERNQRLDAAAAIVRADPPTLVRGDLNEQIEALVDAVPAGVTPVVQHTAVLAYLDTAGRDRFYGQMARLPCRWISLEGLAVFPQIDATIPPQKHLDDNRFVLALDGQARAFASAHGQRLRWI
ncbi:DUF2332 domain-containing protein [Microbacterium sp. MPKO10]|uniref:DUF2332 domain-containing protein n=1 Tax=Microbacterium sp. MPKO10 TaxID=2989818 RepID=UPI0022356011|nr:DUF2332 domain-containing protein [Microbacterium sp. MPKO10]MCW4457705.1 DUF2332 domain-containing protein [Microbacterium sp. MPKO10]